MGPVIGTKKERKNRIKRECYRKGDKFENNTMTIPNGKIYCTPESGAL